MAQPHILVTICTPTCIASAVTASPQSTATKMDPVPLQMHLNYMTDAAYLLRVSAPETSAYIMSRRNELVFQRGGAQNDVQKQNVCNACGHIMIPGQDATTMALEGEHRVRRRAAPKRKSATAKGRAEAKRSVEAPVRPPRPPTAKVFHCGFCAAVTRIRSPRTA